MSCGVGHRQGLDLTLLWLWCTPAAVALIGPLAWEPPYAAGAALKTHTHTHTHTHTQTHTDLYSQSSGAQKSKISPIGLKSGFQQGWFFLEAPASIPFPLPTPRGRLWSLAQGSFKASLC